MADELAHFSVLDDESSTSYFLNWAGNFGGGATLRGGDRVDSNTLPDAQIDVEVSGLTSVNTVRAPNSVLGHQLPTLPWV